MTCSQNMIPMKSCSKMGSKKPGYFTQKKMVDHGPHDRKKQGNPKITPKKKKKTCTTPLKINGWNIIPWRFGSDHVPFFVWGIGRCSTANLPGCENIAVQKKHKAIRRPFKTNLNNLMVHSLESKKSTRKKISQIWRFQIWGCPRKIADFKDVSVVLEPCEMQHNTPGKTDEFVPSKGTSFQ